MANIFIIAGETSGDIHGAGLVRELLELKPELTIWGIGGSQMRAAGIKTEYDISELAFLGFSEVIKHLPFIHKVMKNIKDLIKKRKPDLIILIDYPGFNLRIAEFAHSLKFKILYYISPQVWSWAHNRVKKIARYVDQMAVIFEFEKKFYQRFKIPVSFVGHPLLESMNISLSRQEYCQKYGLDSSRSVLALLAGSRRQEVERILPPMVKIAKEFKTRKTDCQIAVSVTNSLSNDLYDSIIEDLDCVKIPETYPLMAYSTGMMVASGTATLESAIIGTPFLMVYKVSPVTYWLGKILIKIDNLAMANIVAEKKVISEFIQKDFCSEKIVPVLFDMFSDFKKQQKMLKGFEEIRQKLGTPGASRRVAGLALAMMRKNG